MAGERSHGDCTARRAEKDRKASGKEDEKGENADSATDAVNEGW